MKKLIIICSILLATSSCYFYPYSANNPENNKNSNPCCATVCEEHCPTIVPAVVVYYTCEFCGKETYSYTKMRICPECSKASNKCQKCLAPIN